MIVTLLRKVTQLNNCNQTWYVNSWDPEQYTNFYRDISKRSKIIQVKLRGTPN